MTCALLSSARWSRPAFAPVLPTCPMGYVAGCLFLSWLVEITAANPSCGRPVGGSL